MRHVALMLAATTLAGCANDLQIRDRSTFDTWQQSPTDEVDILFVVDNSSSMVMEQDLLAAGFESFMNAIEATPVDGSQIDFHIGVITTDFQYDDPERGRLIGNPAVITRETPDFVGVFEDRALVGTGGQGKEKGLEAAAFALSPTMTTGPNAGFLRQGANLLVVMVSDEDDCSDEGALGPDAENVACYQQDDKLVPVANYTRRFIDLKGDVSRVQVAAIVGPVEATDLCDDGTVPGRRYLEIARDTGGLVASICDPTWDSFLSELGLNAAGIFTVFQLSHGAKPGTLTVTVAGEEVPLLEEDRATILAQELSGVLYDAEGETIEFFGDAVPPRDSQIKAEYVIEPGT